MSFCQVLQREEQSLTELCATNTRLESLEIILGLLRRGTDAAESLMINQYFKEDILEVL